MRVKPTPVSAFVAAAFALAAWGSAAGAADSPPPTTPPAATTPAATGSSAKTTPPAQHEKPKEAKPAKPTAPAPTGIAAPWGAGRQWMSFRVGTAKSNTEDAANGSIGGGIGFSRMLSGKVWKYHLLPKFSFGGFVEVNQLGQFGSSSELEVPVTLELTRHFRLGSDYFRPYVGFGAGAYYRKLYRTGDDFAETKPGVYLTTGANLPLDFHQVIGFDLRFSRVNATNGPGGNPVFGPGTDSALHWGLKFNYAYVY